MGHVVDQDLAARVRGLMPRLRSDLEALVRTPSVSAPGRIDDPLLDAFEMTSRLFADAGVTVDRLDLPDTAPVVTGEIPAPPGAPTVLLYSHYDVVPRRVVDDGDPDRRPEFRCPRRSSPPAPRTTRRRRCS